MDTQEKIARLKFLFQASGKKSLSDTEATGLIRSIDKMQILATLITYGVGLAVYFTAGAVAGSLLGLSGLHAGAAFVVIRLALNYSPTLENQIAKVNIEKKAIGGAIANAPTDPAILSELLGQSQFGNPDNTPKA